ncbi:MAG: hypothetical protein KC441_17420 [Anaerolineales bacterium]|nr:hypothetical protein [Anaerolineales bacterium]
MNHLDIPRRYAYFSLLIGLLVLFVLAGLAACSATSGSNGAMEGMDTPTDAGDMSGMDHEMDHTEDMTGMEMDGVGHDAEARRFVPNDGAVVHIMSPADGAVYKSSDDVPVMIETTNFTVGDEGKHWHIYLDGSPTMVMGGTSFVLQNLSPGEHEIEVFLSLATHEDLEQGDKVIIVVEE